MNRKRRAAGELARAGAWCAGCLRDRLATGLLAILTCLAVLACKQAADTSKPVGQTPKTALQASARSKSEDSLVQQAASSCRQRIQEAAREHAADTKRVQEASVLDMKEVTQREQLETKRAVVRSFQASNVTLKSLLVNEEAVFAEAMAKLDVPPARMQAESKSFQSVIPNKAAAIRMREAEERIGNALLGALGLLDEIWGQWSYNQDYGQVQFSPPGALKRYNDLQGIIEAASREQKALQEQ